MRPNRKAWNVGDIVIHANEAKETKMLRVVTWVNGDLIGTEYAHPEMLPLKYALKKFRDLNIWLHDPKRYDVKESGLVEVVK